jgi:predicted MFS family arabinose efflux permease
LGLDDISFPFGYRHLHYSGSQCQIFGLIYGFVEAGIGIAGALGAWVAGIIFDRNQSYKMAFVLAIIVLLLSCLFIWLAAPRKARRW